MKIPGKIKWPAAFAAVGIATLQLILYLGVIVVVAQCATGEIW